MLNKEKPVKVIIDKEKCTKCGACIKACKGKYLIWQDGEIGIGEESLFGCIQCGRCMIKCPHNAIIIEGEGISGDSLIEFPTSPTDYDDLYSLLLKRRSARKFEDRPVEKELIEKVLAAATTGPLSIPPYEVKALVINGKEKVAEFKNDLMTSFEKMLKVFSPLGMWLLRPIMGPYKQKLLKEFVAPLFRMTLDENKKGNDILFYDAPTVVIFYTSPICDREDAIIATTLAGTAAESLGLGTCIIGSVPPSINNNPQIKAKYGIAKDEQVASAFILGYPKETFDKGIKRDFKEVRWY